MELRCKYLVTMVRWHRMPTPHHEQGNMIAGKARIDEDTMQVRRFVERDAALLG